MTPLKFKADMFVTCGRHLFEAFNAVEMKLFDKICSETIITINHESFWHRRDSWTRRSDDSFRAVVLNRESRLPRRASI